MPLLDAARALADGLARLIYPGACWICGQSLPSGQADFCAACRDALMQDPFPACPRCAGTVGPFASRAEGCTSCRHDRFAFEKVVRLGPYEGRLKEAILRMKFQAGEGVAEALGDLWGDHAGLTLRRLGASAVVPVPLHWRRRWQRGYNQSEALGLALAQRLGLPCRPSWLRRTRATPHQTQQSPTDRRANVNHAFRASTSVKGLTVLLVDDVFTTGSTADDAARALRSAGASHIFVAVLAHAK